MKAIIYERERERHTHTHREREKLFFFFFFFFFYFFLIGFFLSGPTIAIAIPTHTRPSWSGPSLLLLSHSSRFLHPLLRRSLHVSLPSPIANRPIAQSPISSLHLHHTITDSFISFFLSFFLQVIRNSYFRKTTRYLLSLPLLLLRLLALERKTLIFVLHPHIRNTFFFFFFFFFITNKPPTNTFPYLSIYLCFCCPALPCCTHLCRRRHHRLRAGAHRKSPSACPSKGKGMRMQLAYGGSSSDLLWHMVIRARRSSTSFRRHH